MGHSCLKRHTEIDLESPNFAVNIRASLPLIVDLFRIQARIRRLKIRDVNFRLTCEIHAHFGTVAALAEKHQC
ncbi:MAG: hypothetical protein WBA18_10230 [Terracidiphilus sp.]